MSDDRSREFVEDLLRSHSEEVVKGLVRGLLTLDGEPFDAVMREAAAACRARFLRVANFPSDLDLDEMIQRMASAGPDRIEITRSGDEILWRELREGRCMCPMVRSGIVDLDARMCTCAAEWARGLVEMCHGGPVDVEIVETIAGGSRSCLFRLKLGAQRSRPAT